MIDEEIHLSHHSADVNIKSGVVYIFLNENWISLNS